MLRSLRNLSLTSLGLAALGMLAAPALAVPPDIASRAGRYATQRAAAERNSLREPEAAQEEEEIPADAEVADDIVEASASEPVGTGTRTIRRAAHQVPVGAPHRRTAPQSETMRAGHRTNFVPGHQRMGRGQFTSVHQEMEASPEEIPMPMGEQLRESAPPAGAPYYDGYGEGYGPGLGNGHFGNGRLINGQLGRNWGDNCDPCCIPGARIGYFEAFAGAHAFTGPLNRGTGSFGFQEGLNAGMPLFCGITLQAGINATQSNFEGAPFTPDDRTQFFTTVGAFRRMDLGLQAGVVVDFLHDEWDYSLDVAQLRGELSWLMPCGNELGFWYNIGFDPTSSEARIATLTNDTIEFTTGTLEVEPVDIYAFFYRRQLACGGEGRLFAGFTDDSRGLLGGNIRLPLNPCWQFSTDFLYAVSSDDAQFAFNDESWNLSCNLVWTPFGTGSGAGGCQNYCRPLFDVVNNGSFLTRLP